MFCSKSFLTPVFWKLSNKYIQLIIFITESNLPLGSISMFSPPDWYFRNHPCIDLIDLILTILLPNAKITFHLTLVALSLNLNSNNINSQHYLFVIMETMNNILFKESTTSKNNSKEITQKNFCQLLQNQKT